MATEIRAPRFISTGWVLPLTLELATEVVKLSVSSDLMLELALVAFWEPGTQPLKGVNTFLGKDMRFAQKKPKFGWRQLNFGRQDCFLDNLMYGVVKALIYRVLTYILAMYSHVGLSTALT